MFVRWVDLPVYPRRLLQLLICLFNRLIDLRVSLLDYQHDDHWKIRMHFGILIELVESELYNNMMMWYMYILLNLQMHLYYAKLTYIFSSMFFCFSCIIITNPTTKQMCTRLRRSIPLRRTQARIRGCIHWCIRMLCISTLGGGMCCHSWSYTASKTDEATDELTNSST